jgi:hypothetical protein
MSKDSLSSLREFLDLWADIEKRAEARAEEILREKGRQKHG